MKRTIMMFLISLTLLAPALASASDLGGVRFSLIQGDVQVRTEDTNDWVPASVNMPLREGDRIWVPEDGVAELQTKDGSYLRLADRSALEILTLDRDSHQAYLTEGRLYSYFTGDGDSLLQIDTSASSVRAQDRSKFMVDVPQRGPVQVSVLQGEVTVENRDGVIRVASGEMLSLGEGAFSEKSTLGSPDEWERWNWERDRKIAERRPPVRHLPEELQPYSNDFYDNGRWVYTPDYGYVWTPAVSVSVGWAPYRYGRWVWIGGDYVWVSYEPWGWVPYHYGRWSFVVSIGWCWVPPARGAVYWGPGYVGWVYTSRRVAWVPLAPREVYYGRGYYGPHSVNITNVNVTNVYVGKVVYKNVRVNNAVTTVNHETFVRGRPADALVKENPFLTEKVHLGRPPIKPEKTSAMPVVREVPEAKRPPEPVRQVNVKELKEKRPMVRGGETSVFGPENKPREMPVKAGETKPVQKSSDRTKEMRQPAKSTKQTRPSAPAERRGSPSAPAETKVQIPKEVEKTKRSQERPGPPEGTSPKVQEQKQRAPADKGRSRSTPLEPAVNTRGETRAPDQGMEKTRQEQRQRVPDDKGVRQSTPSKPVVETPKERRAPERGTNKGIESRASGRAVQPTRQPERVQPKSKEESPPENVIKPAPEPRNPEKRSERPMRGPRNSEKGG